MLSKIVIPSSRIPMVSYEMAETTLDIDARKSKAEFSNSVYEIDKEIGNPETDLGPITHMSSFHPLKPDSRQVKKP